MIELKKTEMTPEEVRNGAVRHGEYADAIGRFVSSGEEIVEVSREGKKPATVLQGLRNQIAGLDAPVEAVKAGNRVFLVLNKE